MATKKTTTNKETTKKTTSTKKAEETPKKTTVAKKTTEDTVKKSASKKKEDTTTKKDTVKKDSSTKKTASVKKAEETHKKTTAAAKKTAEDTSKKEDTVKKTAVKKTSSVVKKEDEVKAIEVNKEADKIEKPKTLDSIIKKEDEKKEEKKDLKELIKNSQDRKISLKTSTPVRKIDSIKTESTDSKPERESITLLKEAIKAKSKNVSRPVSVKKRILIDDNDDSIANDNIPLNISKPVSSSLFNSSETVKEKDENIFSFNKFDSDKKENTEENISDNKDDYSKIYSSNSITDTYHFEKLDEDSNEDKDIEEAKTDNTELEEEKDEIVENIDNEESEETEDIKEDEENDQDEDDIKEAEEINDEMEEIKEIAEVSETEEIKEYKKDNTEEKATYSKSDIFKRVVIPNLHDSEEVQKSKFKQEEIDKAVESAPIIHENEKVENYKNYTLDQTIEDEKTEDNEKLQELREKDIKIIETEDELKTSSFPEIERKPVEPYVAPAHSMENNKKQNKLVPIIGIIIIILGLSFLGIQFFTGKNNNNTDDGFYDIITNETIDNNADTNNNAVLTQTNTAIENTNAVRPQTNNTRPQTNNAVNTQTNTIRPQTNNTRPQTNNTVNTQTNTVRPQTNNTRPQTNTARPQTNNAVNTQTNTRVQTNTPPTPPKEPEITPPTPPTPPPNPPAANNTNASASGVNQNNISGLNTYKTQWNDTLSSIATKELGDARRWPSIFVLNQDLMKTPDNIVFNINIKIPNGGKKKVDDMTDSERRSLYNDYLKVAEIYSRIGNQNQANRIKSQANSILK